MALDFPNSPTTGQTYTSGSVTWKWDGAKWVITSPAGAPLVLNQQVFTASGTYTPTPGMVNCDVECVGGGAGGCGAGAAAANTFIISAGGGGGGYARKFLAAAVIGSSQTVTIGAGGLGGAAGANNGGAGGDT